MKTAIIFALLCLAQYSYAASTASTASNATTAAATTPMDLNLTSTAIAPTTAAAGLVSFNVVAMLLAVIYAMLN